MENVHESFACRDVEHPCFRLKYRRIHSRADRERLNHFSAVCIQHHQVLRIAAAAKQPPMRRVHRQRGRRACGCQRPAGFDLQRVRVDRHQFGLVFKIHKYGSFAVRHGKLRPAAQCDRSHHLAAFCINYRRAVRVPIHYEDSLRRRIVRHAVCVFVRLRFAGQRAVSAVGVGELG